MKICPNCQIEFRQRKRECCPHCGKAIVFACGKWRLAEDKQTVDDILLKVRTHIEKRDGIKIPFEPSAESRDRAITYEYVDRASAFLNAQKEKISITPRDFLLGLFDFILENKWYASHLNNVMMLYNRISDFAKDYYQKLRREWQREHAEIKQMSLVGNVKIRYGI